MITIKFETGKEFHDKHMKIKTTQTSMPLIRMMRADDSFWFPTKVEFIQRHFNFGSLDDVWAKYGVETHVHGEKREKERERNDQMQIQIVFWIQCTVSIIRPIVTEIVFKILNVVDKLSMRRNLLTISNRMSL